MLQRIGRRQLFTRFAREAMIQRAEARRAARFIVSGRAVDGPIRLWKHPCSPQRFSFRLSRKPYPDAGQPIAFAWRDQALKGTVEEVIYDPARWGCDVVGQVEAFHCRSLFDD